MKSKFFVILVCCVLALAVLMSSTSGVELTKDKLLVPTDRLLVPIRSALPHDIVRFADQLPSPAGAYPETDISATGVAGANADRMTNRVWIVAMNDGLAPDDLGRAGFKTNGLRNIGPSAQLEVTVTVTVNILQKQAEPLLVIAIYKDGYYLFGQGWGVRLGIQSQTTNPFTMDPDSDYHAIAYIVCASQVEGQTESVVAEITDIRFQV